ncbi:MAG TPA: hypothetical protein VKX28_12625 [Xanthobacteraceae bacterium]|nr:hypothetical protein [Xanthobacteraceae bacterium]
MVITACSIREFQHRHRDLRHDVERQQIEGADEADEGADEDDRERLAKDGSRWAGIGDPQVYPTTFGIDPTFREPGGEYHRPVASPIDCPVR